MIKGKGVNVAEMLDQLINMTMPKVMELIFAEEGVEPPVKATRVSMANTVLHHLKLLRAAYES